MSDETKLALPGQSLADIFKEWEAKGITPMEMAPERLEQVITIRHNALTGKLTWRSEKLDGAQVMGLMADVTIAMFTHFFGDAGRPALSSGAARIAIALEGDEVQLAVEPTNDPVVVKGLLFAALWRLILETSANPKIGIGEFIRFDRKEL